MFELYAEKRMLQLAATVSFTTNFTIFRTVMRAGQAITIRY